LRRAAHNDIYALSGLANNLSLSPRELHWVQHRAYALAGSLKSEENLWINFGGDKGYPTREEDLPSIIRGDVERTISKLRFERELSKFRVSNDNRSTPESKVEWTEAEKFDYLTSLSLNTSMRAIFAQCCGVASGVGLIVFSIAYVLGNSLALSLFLFLLCSWLGWLIAYRAVRWTEVPPPWVGAQTYRARYKQLWGTGPRMPPLIEERPVPILDPEAKARRQKLEETVETYRKEQKERWEHLAAYKLRRHSLARLLKQHWYLVKRKLRLLKGR
jgi:hypothetical protein